MAVPMEINVKSALNDIFEGENVPLEGEEKPVKKEEDPEQDEGVECSVFQLAENVEQSPIDNPRLKTNQNLLQKWVMRRAFTRNQPT